MGKVLRATALAVLLGAIAAPTESATQYPPVGSPERDQLIQRCLEYWQPFCRDVGVSDPRQPRNEPQPTDQGTSPTPPDDAAEQAAREKATREQAAREQAAREREQIVERCRADWQPSCTEFGVTDPEVQRRAALKAREVRTARTLLAEGPSGVAFPEPNRFSTTAFIQSGWPVVIRYQIPAGSTAKLTVTPRFERGAPFAVALPRSSDGSPQVYSFVAGVPGSDGGVLVAEYEIRARSVVDGGEVVAPVKILSIGAGERALASLSPDSEDRGASGGSAPSGTGRFLRPGLFHLAAMTYAEKEVAIDAISYDPPLINRPKDNSTIVLTYRYVLRNAWDRVAEDLWQACNSASRCILLRPRLPYRPTAQGPSRWEWFVNRGTKDGMYQLVIRAWKTCGAHNNATAFEQCGNAADWVIGSAGPILIR